MKTDGTRSLLDGLEEEGPVPSCAHQWEEAHQWRYEWRSPDGPGYSRVDERVARCRRCGEVRPWNAADEAAFEARLRAAKRMDAHDYIDGLRKKEEAEAEAEEVREQMERGRKRLRSMNEP